MAVDWTPLPSVKNFAKQILMSNCSRPPWIYIETFFPVYIEWFITTTFPFDFNDLVRARAGQLAHGGKGGRHKKGKRVKGSVPKNERFASKGLKHLLRWTQPLENIGFAWLIYSATDQAFMNWTSLIQEAGYCTTPIERGPFIRSTTPLNVFPNPGGGSLPLVELDENPAGWGNTFGSLAWPAGGYKVIFVATIQPLFGDYPNIGLRLHVATPFGTRTFDGERVDAKQHQAVDLWVDLSWHRTPLGAQSLAWSIVGPVIPIGVPVTTARIIVFRFA